MDARKAILWPDRSSERVGLARLSCRLATLHSAKVCACEKADTAEQCFTGCIFLHTIVEGLAENTIFPPQYVELRFDCTAMFRRAWLNVLSDQAMTMAWHQVLSFRGSSTSLAYVTNNLLCSIQLTVHRL